MSDVQRDSVFRRGWIDVWQLARPEEEVPTVVRLECPPPAASSAATSPCCIVIIASTAGLASSPEPLAFVTAP